MVGCSYAGLEPGRTRNLLGAAMCLVATSLQIGGSWRARQEDKRIGLSVAIGDGTVHPATAPSLKVIWSSDPPRMSCTKFARSRVVVLSREACYAEGLSEVYRVGLSELTARCPMKGGTCGRPWPFNCANLGDASCAETLRAWPGSPPS